MLEPVIVVSRVRGPPSIGISYMCRSPGCASVETRKNVVLSRDSSADESSNLPEVSATGAAPGCAASTT